MVDKQQLSKLDPQKILSTSSRDLSIQSVKTTMVSDHSRGHRRSLSASRESKIGNRITTSFLEKEKNYLKNPTDYDNIIEENNSFSIEENKEEIIKETIRINILITIDNKEFVKFVNVSITNKVIVFDLLKECIKLFNELFEKENFPARLNPVLENYYIRPSKKNGKPDYELPSIFLLILHSY